MIRSGQKEKWIIYTLATLLCLVLASFWLMCNIYARYTSEASGSDEARVALWGSSQSIVLAESEKLPQKPGDRCVYTLSVSNRNRNNKESEVAQKYYMEVVTAGNLPLSYSISEGNQEIATFNETAQDKIWNIDKADMVFQTGNVDARTYTLTVTWPTDQKNAELAGVPDFIRINIYAEQLD